MTPCECSAPHERRRIVLTGGPGAGKTALLELIRQSFCSHVTVLPEAASIVFGGGFPRHSDPECQRAAQRAIYHVQRQLEITGDSHNAAIVLCDRGTLDGLAYWPGALQDFWLPLGTDRARELARYDAVIHLRTPTAELGYNHQNPLGRGIPDGGSSSRPWTFSTRRHAHSMSCAVSCRSAAAVTKSRPFVTGSISIHQAGNPRNREEW
jgi:predicted ATPase